MKLTFFELKSDVDLGPPQHLGWSTLWHQLTAENRLCKTLWENTVSQDISQDIQKQNTLNKVIVKNLSQKMPRK